MSYQTTTIPSSQLIDRAEAESFKAFSDVNEIRTATLNSLMSKPELISFEVVKEVDELLKKELLEKKRKHNHWLAMSKIRKNLESPIQVQIYKL
ncbi:hypothetical protein [Vibrio anguillarum]|uniref:Uncharacterized protein n=2 Tax=Vibrio anguillarum TaxID=55601 RepID=A0ABR9Z7J4_VIBAN|nr:hypothetical protein [Vibrio anguillarum]MBF4374419.1 hypothetical protein [Vibrio anguillarum]